MIRNVPVRLRKTSAKAVVIVGAVLVALLSTSVASAQQNLAQVPLFLTSSVPGAVMINMSVDSQLFFTAFPDSADLSGDGAPDRGYIHDVDYFGYFDPYKCYTYSTSDGRFKPSSTTSSKYCSGNWSGNFLNWLTMARIDTVRQILYGGKRHIDTPNLTVLERTYLPNDAHSWVRFYDGDDLDKLSPFSSEDETVTDSPTALSIVDGSRRDSADRFQINTPGWSGSDVFEGDQIEMTHTDYPGLWMRGVVTNTDTGGSNSRVTVQITGSENPDNLAYEISGWQVVNRSRRGVSFCNTTIASGASHESSAINAPPLLKVARGDYSLWTANERWQCRWREDVSPGIPDRMRIHNRPFANGNDVVSSGIWSNADMPKRDEVRIDEFDVRVEVCVEGMVETERCQPYGVNEVLKPVGLLQQFSEDDLLHFGLMTGSFTNHVSGGVLRKNLGTFGDEVNPDTGQFTLPTDSLVRSLDALRIFGYSHSSGEYTAGNENCVFGTSKSQMIGGRCYSWGNPQAEIYAESLRYLAGLNANSDFTHSGNDRIPNLTAADWDNPITEDLWCTPKSIIQFNASVTSFDDGAPSAASDLPGLGPLNDWTNIVGSGEGLAGASVFAGGDGFCTAETIGNLADFSGICPEAPNQDGTYHIAGLAHYAYTSDLRPGWTGEQSVRTYGVSLAPAVPRIEIPLPGASESTVVILPACDNRGDDLRCQLADFQIVEQDIEAGTGSFFIQWDVAEWGADFDMDINGTLRYEIDGNQISVTTQTWADSSGRETGFGYIISGTDNDGFHAHSGINSYTRTNPGTSVPNCSSCNVGDSPTTATFNVGGGTAELLREPLFYAAKWGGYDKSLDESRKADSLDGFPKYGPTWEDSERPGLPQNYFFAVNPEELLEGLEAALTDFLGRIETSATAAAVSSAVIQEDTRAFFAGFRSTDWSGTLSGRPIDVEGQVAPDGCAECWNAEDTLADQVAAGTRKIFTRATGATGMAGSGGGVIFEWGNLHNDQSSALNHSPQGVDDTRGSDRVEWLIGEEKPGMRARSQRFLGDIVNSDPVFHDGVLYVGSNGGMLHAFDAETGEELFAYVPSQLLLPEPGEDFAPLTRLMEPGYVDNHRYFVDGKIEIRQVHDGSDLRAVLVGSLGAGGRQVFALDVTEPDGFSPSDVLWEFSHEELGASIGTPQISRTQPDGEWGVFFGNGYGSESHEAGLFVVDLFDGNKIAYITTNEGNAAFPNGLATPLVSDWVSRGFRAERVYAGDRLGNLWAFDVSHSAPSGWSPRLLALATDPSGMAQPITTRPAGRILDNGSLMISFGTGSFMFGSDADDNQVQSLYGVVDTISTSSSAAERSDLVAQEIIYQATVGTAGGPRELRVLSDNEVDLSLNRGWILDLDRNAGERVVSNPTTLGRREQRVRFSSLIPDDDLCGTGRGGFFFDLNLRTGGRLERPVFDLDGDREFDDDDLIDVPGEPDPLPPSVISHGQGESMVELDVPDPDQGFQWVCDGQGNCEAVRGDDRIVGRMNWQQLR
ncbi:PQQ-binding-like beta-propeller repeat protein [Ectothiorhodospira haloalkaliphila]|uniref:pilus assembly protein n=1 Tax=Ectothiorhodospira haloalkaliphila TaxID=421628 RepID=UPI001EE8DB67|nr:PilC/PilY family type IV pilus protein [Ectothiorhodospira haloalkaliphila]MCG5523592.1 PQQ-binding-like beta-propeller repeat protein [Ectothiorhodospira haloalkaliphila]